MAEEEKKYVVYGMRAKCSEGSMENYISTDVGHGVVYQGNPLLNANDHTPQVNLTHFGDCHSKLIYEEAKKQADEKYKADADDGFFSKAGKFIARNVTKAALTAKEYLGANKCELDTPLPWMFANEEHMIDGAPALTMESQCACRFGGVISIVPVEEEVEAEEAEASTEDETEDVAEDAEGIAAVNIMPAVAAIGFTMSKSPETSDEEGMEGNLASVAQAAAKMLKEGRMTVEGKTKKEEAVSNSQKPCYSDSTKELIMQFEGEPFYEARINDDGSYTIGYGYDFTEKSDPEMFKQYLVKNDDGSVRRSGKVMTEEEAQENIKNKADKLGITEAVDNFINGKGSGNTSKVLIFNQNQYDALFSYIYSNGQYVFERSKYKEWKSYGGEWRERAEARKELKKYLIEYNGNYDAEKIEDLFVNCKGGNVKYAYEERRKQEAALFSSE